MQNSLLLTAGLLFVSATLTNCGREAETRPATESASAVKTQEMDYDAFTSLECEPGESRYQISIVKGTSLDFTLHQVPVIINRDCKETMVHAEFVCVPKGKVFLLRIKYKGEFLQGAPTAFDDAKDCKGYSTALNAETPG